MDINVYVGYIVDAIEVNGEFFGPSGRGSRVNVPIGPGEIILRLEYGINSDWPGQDYNNAICGLYFVTNYQKLGPYAPCETKYSTAVPRDESLSAFLSSNAILKSGENNFILGFKARVSTVFHSLVCFGKMDGQNYYKVNGL